MNFRKFLKGVKNSEIETTGLLLGSTPILAAVEVFGSGMDVAISLESRLKAAGLGYFGLGWAYGKGRNISKKFFKVGDEYESSKWKYTLHDGTYNVLFNAALLTPIYLSSGADIWQTTKAIAIGSGLRFFTGIVNGYCMDVMKDLGGVEETSRLPKKIRDLEGKVKKALAVGLIATSIAATAGVYKIKDMATRPIENSEYGLTKKGAKDSYQELDERFCVYSELGKNLD